MHNKDITVSKGIDITLLETLPAILMILVTKGSGKYHLAETIGH
jgi:hypothetical protein